MSLEKGAHALVVEEMDEGHTGPGQHHDEGGGLAGGLANDAGAEGRPVHLGLLTGQRAQALVGLGRLPRPQRREQAPKVAPTSRVAPLRDHRVKPARRQRRVRLQRLLNEGKKRLDHRRACGDGDRDTLVMQDPLHGAVVDTHLARDGPHRPLLDEVQAEDAFFDVLGDHHFSPSASSQGTATRQLRQGFAARTAATVPYVRM